MNNKYITIIVVSIMVLLSTYFLVFIFSDKNTTKNTSNSLPVISITEITPTAILQNSSLAVIATAKPNELGLPGGNATINLTDAAKSTLEIKYYNNSKSEHTGFQVQLLNGQSIKYRTGSTTLAKFNKEDTTINKRATYDVPRIKPGEVGTITLVVYALEPGTLNFRALLTTKDGLSATSKPIFIAVH